MTRQFALLCLSLLLLPPGCTTPTPTVTPIPTATTVPPTDTHSPVPSPTLTVTPTPVRIVLPAVTMSPQEAEAALQELLRTNGSCTGKCLAGIRPDEMTVQEAINRMAQWGMLAMDGDKDGRTFINILQLTDPRQKQVDVRLTLTLRKKFETTYTVSFYIPRREYGDFLGEDVWLANRETWRAFRLDNLIKAYGLPSYVGFSFQTNDQKEWPINYGIEMQYEKINLLIGIGALAHINRNNVSLCPSQDPHSLGIEINPERPLNDVQQFYPITWQALTGTGLDAFYQKFTDEPNSDTCVITTLEKIIALDPSFR